MEGLDVGRCHPQGFKEIRLGDGQSLLHLGGGDLQSVQVGAVKLFGVIPQGIVPPGPHIGDDGVHHRLHILFGPQIPVQHLVGGQVFQTVKLNHFISSFWLWRRARARRSCSSIRSVWGRLNW